MNNADPNRNLFAADTAEGRGITEREWHRLKVLGNASWERAQETFRERLMSMVMDCVRFSDGSKNAENKAAFEMNVRRVLEAMRLSFKKGGKEGKKERK